MLMGRVPEAKERPEHRGSSDMGGARAQSDNLEDLLVAEISRFVRVNAQTFDRVGHERSPTK